MSQIIAQIREAKPALLRRAGQFIHVIATFVITMTVAARLSAPTIDPEWKTPKEAFDASLSRLDTLDEVIDAAREQSRRPSKIEMVYQIEQVLRFRFYHGYTRYGLHENWAAWLAARTVHPNLDAIVMPDEIIQHGAAACSQQAIVVQAALSRLGITYATVEVPEHFFTAAWIDGQWYVVDPWGPNERDRTRLFKLEELMTIEGRKRMFPQADASAKWDRLRFSVPRLVKIDQFPAVRALLFHRVTGWISDWLWLPLLSLVLARMALRRPPPWAGLIEADSPKPAHQS